MDSETNDVSAFQAKTHLSELLRETEGGQSYVIRRRGKPVARLMPPEDNPKPDFSDLADSFREVRRRIRVKVNIRALVEEGRRH